MLKKYLLGLCFLTLIVVLTACGNIKANPTVNSTSGQRYNKRSNLQSNINNQQNVVQYTGEIGEKVNIENNQVQITSSSYSNGTVKYYNTKLDDKIVYFFIVKDNDGVFRAAGNACQVCAESKMGFRHEGNFMICNTCGNKYPLEKIATEKGGCNPVPINPELEVANGTIIIEKSDLQKIIEYF